MKNEIDSEPGRVCLSLRARLWTLGSWGPLRAALAGLDAATAAGLRARIHRLVNHFVRALRWEYYARWTLWDLVRDRLPRVVERLPAGQVSAALQVATAMVARGMTPNQMLVNLMGVARRHPGAAEGALHAAEWLAERGRDPTHFLLGVADAIWSSDVAEVLRIADEMDQRGIDPSDTLRNLSGAAAQLGAEAVLRRAEDLARRGLDPSATIGSIPYAARMLSPDRLAAWLEVVDRLAAQSVDPAWLGARSFMETARSPETFAACLSAVAALGEEEVDPACFVRWLDVPPGVLTPEYLHEARLLARAFAAQPGLLTFHTHRDVLDAVKSLPDGRRPQALAIARHLVANGIDPRGASRAIASHAKLEAEVLDRSLFVAMELASRGIDAGPTLSIDWCRFTEAARTFPEDLFREAAAFAFRVIGSGRGQRAVWNGLVAAAETSRTLAEFIERCELVEEFLTRLSETPGADGEIRDRWPAFLAEIARWREAGIDYRVRYTPRESHLGDTDFEEDVWIEDRPAELELIPIDGTPQTRG